MLFSTSFIFAKEPNNLTDLLSQEAIVYRDKGLEAQNSGSLNEALSFYQKAIELNPLFATAYNDLGILYEEKGITDRAEESYQKAIAVDSNCLSAYTNLALLYEGKRDLDKAIYFWKKRAELGSLGDPWALNAKKHADDLSLILSTNPTDYIKERENLGIPDGRTQAPQRQDNKALANKHFMKAKECFKRKDYATAIKEALDAQQLDPTDERIDKFIEKVQLRALSN